MNFDKQGWLKRYLEFRSSHPFANRLATSGVKVLEEPGLHHELDEAIYYFLQPTGLLYGFPVGLPLPVEDYPGVSYLSPLDRAHLIFLDSLFACLVADRHYLLDDLTDEPDRFLPTVAMASSYFQRPDGAERPSRVSLRRWMPGAGAGEGHARLERALHRLMGKGSEFFRLPGNYYNSFLFLDLYYCMVWQRRMLVEPEAAADHHRELAEQQQSQRELLIRIMIAAAASSGGVAPTEQRLVEWFIRSSGLPPERIAALREALQQGQMLDGAVLPGMPWLVRRFMLDAALMTILVDRELDPEEELFLEELVLRLELWKEELSQSLLALEVFILHQEPQLQIFHNRPALLNASDNIRARGSLMIRKNLNRIVQEIRETQELYLLLMKSTHIPLTAEEKRKVRLQLLDILKTIPALAIFAMPGGSLVLPVLIRLLPFNLLPSAFEED